MVSNTHHQKQVLPLAKATVSLGETSWQQNFCAPKRYRTEPSTHDSSYGFSSAKTSVSVLPEAAGKFVIGEKDETPTTDRKRILLHLNTKSKWYELSKQSSFSNLGFLSSPWDTEFALPSQRLFLTGSSHWAEQKFSQRPAEVASPQGGLRARLRAPPRRNDPPCERGSLRPRTAFPFRPPSAGAAVFLGKDYGAIVEDGQSKSALWPAGFFFSGFSTGEKKEAYKRKVLCL